MRMPTNKIEAYAWHTDALKGLRPLVHEDLPQCGWYRRRLVKGGPWVPARIWLHQVIDPETGELAEPEIMRCEIDGAEQGAIHSWTWLAKNPISESRFREMTDAKSWAGSNNPTSPVLNPTAPVDLARNPTFPGGR